MLCPSVCPSVSKYVGLSVGHAEVEKLENVKEGYEWGLYAQFAQFAHSMMLVDLKYSALA